jgi:hypothetical protein
MFFSSSTCRIYDGHDIAQVEFLATCEAVTP